MNANAYAFVETDSRGRVALGRWLQAGRQYMVETDAETGVVTLEPVGMVLSDEAVADMVQNPERVAAMLGRARSIARDGAPPSALSVDDLFDDV